MIFMIWFLVCRMVVQVGPAILYLPGFVSLEVIPLLILDLGLVVEFRSIEVVCDFIMPNFIVRKIGRLRIDGIEVVGIERLIFNLGRFSMGFIDGRFVVRI